MKRALVLARRALGLTSPNPMVGAIVLDSRNNSVGQGFHARAGQAHAEVVALKNAGRKAKGGTLYVTLEPCCHHGRTPPCTQTIIEAGIKKVVVACLDSTPKVDGKGMAQLREAGIQTQLLSGPLRAQAQDLNQAFFHSQARSEALLTVKTAISRDGYMGSLDQRQRISSSACLPHTMRLRAEAGAILVGARTFQIDRPQLTVRGPWLDRRPLRIIVDPDLAVSPADFKTQPCLAPWCVYTWKSHRGSSQADKLAEAGVSLIYSQEDTSPSGNLSIKQLKKQLFDPAWMQSQFGREPMNALLLEGGAYLIEAAHMEKTVDRWFIYQSKHRFSTAVSEKRRVKFPVDKSSLGTLKSAIRRASDIEYRYGA